MFIPMVICTAVPNGLSESIRPDFAALGRDNIAIHLVKFIYAADSPPRSVMPSMHCSVAVALFFAVIQSESLAYKKWPKICAGILSFLIVLSTVFIKQHSILDLFAGVMFGLAAALIVRIIEVRARKRKAV